MTAPGERVELSFSTEQLDTFCRQVCGREREPADALRALTTLQAFLAGISPGAEHQAAMRELLDRHCEHLRAQVLARASADIVTVIAQQSVPALAACYAHLSRSGFAEATRMALAQSSAMFTTKASEWVRLWLAEIEKQSTVPDAVDFSAAGITPGEYLAMRDLHVEIKHRIACT